MFASVILAAAVFIGTAAHPLEVVTEHGAPVPRAAVDFTNEAGAHDLETTDDRGAAHAPEGFAPVAADVRKAGFRSLHVDLTTAGQRAVVLEPELATIGTVTVAAASQQSLHEAELPASALDRTAIALAPVSTTDSLLRQLPGFDLTRSNSQFTNYGQLRASFSGAGEDRGLVLIDGVPAQDGFGGQIDWLAYPPETLERVEILRGAGSALYGSGAIGGALNLQSFGPRIGAGVVPDGRISAGYGSNAYVDNSLLFGAPIGSTFAASLSAVDTRLEYQDLAPGYQAAIDTPALSVSGMLSPRVRYAAGGTSVDLWTTFASDHQYQGRPNYTFDRALGQGALTIAQTLGPFTARVVYYARNTSIHNLDDQAPAKPGVLRYTQSVPSYENGFIASLDAHSGISDFAAVVDQRRVTGTSTQTGPTGALQSFGTGNELAQGVALQAIVHPGRFEALLGTRFEQNRFDDLSLLNVAKTGTTRSAVPGYDEGAISPRVALRYDVGRDLVLRASTGGGFRSPYLNELVRGYQIGTTVYAPNLKLVPERSRTDDVGLDYLLGRGRFALDAAFIHVNDAIAFVTISPALQMRENVDLTSTQSYTATYTVPVGICTRVRASGTTQNARVASGPAGTIGKQLAYVPTRSALLAVDSAGPGPLAFSATGSYVGQTYADSLQQQPLGPALLFGGTVRATTTYGVSYSLVADNLTQQRYLSSIDRYGPPFTVSLHVGLPIGPDARHDATSCRL